MEEKELTPKESLRIIHEMIESSKERFQDNGYIFLFWGWLISICGLAQFILLQLEYYEINYYPYYLTIPAVAYTWIYESRRHKKKSKPTFFDKIFNALWSSVGFNILLVGFGFSFAFHVSPIPFILILVSIATIVSGTVIKFKPLIIGGIICNGLVVATIFISPLYHPIIIVVALVASYLVPGYILRKKYKQYHA